LPEGGGTDDYYDYFHWRGNCGDRRGWSLFKKRGEERFLSAQADTFAGANVKEKASACFVRNDGGVREAREGECGGLLDLK
jgi:hypothetical protein